MPITAAASAIVMLRILLWGRINGGLCCAARRSKGINPGRTNRLPHKVRCASDNLKFAVEARARAALCRKNTHSTIMTAWSGRICATNLNLRFKAQWPCSLAVVPKRNRRCTSGSSSRRCRRLWHAPDLSSQECSGRAARRHQRSRDGPGHNAAAHAPPQDESALPSRAGGAMNAATAALHAAFFPEVRAHLVEAGSGLGNNGFTPECCGREGECAVICKGYADSGWLLALEDPVPFRQRQYLCKTHARTFSITDADFLSWVYGPDSPYTCEQLQPEPLFVKAGETCYTAELLWDMVSKFEQRVTVKQIVDTTQQRWLGVWQQRRAAFIRHASAEQADFDASALPPADVPLWVHMRQGRGLMVDRSKVVDVLFAYFDTFLLQAFQADLQTAREQLCYGISIDVTFKVAVKCSVAATRDAALPPRRDNVVYVPAAYALQTVFSSVTQMVVGGRFMPSKSAFDKAVGIREVFWAQAAEEFEGHPAQPTLFVATDNPGHDTSMLQGVHGEAFPAGHVAHGCLDIGDDVWHAYHRIGGPGKLPGPNKEPALHASLKRVFHFIYRKADAGDMLPEQAATTCQELFEALDAWAKQHRRHLTAGSR